MPLVDAGGLCSSFSSFLPALNPLPETLGPIPVSICPMTTLASECGKYGHMDHLHGKRKWDWRRGCHCLLKLCHSPNFSAFHGTRCRACFKNWPFKGIMLFFNLKQGKQPQQPHTILYSAASRFCLFTRISVLKVYIHYKKLEKNTKHSIHSETAIVNI